MSLSIDDRTAGTESGFAFTCIDGTGIEVEGCKGALIQGNRIIEENMLPTPEIQKKYGLGKFVKKNAVKGTLISQKIWDEEYFPAWHQGAALHVGMPEIGDCIQVLGNYIENAAQGMDIQADHVIISQNIVNNAFVGMKAMHGAAQRPDHWQSIHQKRSLEHRLDARRNVPRGGPSRASYLGAARPC